MPDHGEMGERLRFSIIIPTFQRQDWLLQTLERLAVIDAPWPIEIIVVVDGSTDQSAEAAAAQAKTWPTTVIVQANSGSAAARNRGAAEARGEVLLFLDDDMLADRRLLIAHDEKHRDGAHAVVGHIPLAPGAPPGLLADGYAKWAGLRAERLRSSGGRVTPADFLTGQLSISSVLFERLGGFDEGLNANGRFGGEDTDFLVRLSRSGGVITFAPDALSWQQYAVEPRRYLQQWEQAGGADAELSRRHPGLGGETWKQHGGDNITAVLARGLAPRAPRLVLGLLDWWIARRVGHQRTDPFTEWTFLKLRDMHYWRGAQQAGGLEGGRPELVVLAYHGIDTLDDPRTGGYSVSPDEFATHIETLRAAGWNFIDGDAFLNHIEGRREVTGRSILLTFDDGYRSVLTNAAPIVRKIGATGVVFVVSSLIGSTNRWDIAMGATPQALMSVLELQALVDEGWEVGAHSMTHAHLPHLGPSELADEIVGARAEIRALGLPLARFFAYPYGENNSRVRGAAARAEYSASFGLMTSHRHPTVRRRHQIPRIEIRQGTEAAQLVKVLASPPIHGRTRILRWFSRRAGALLWRGPFARWMRPQG